MLKKNFTGGLWNNFIGNTKLILFLIVLFGLFLRLIFFSGIGPSDDLAYSSYAAAMHKGAAVDSLENTLAVRTGIIYATSISYKLFGINDFSSVLFVLLTSIAGIILIFYFGKLLFNEKVGLMASFLLSFFPLDVVYSTRLMSDLPSAFFMGLGIYIFLHSELKSKLKYGIGYFLSGVFIGIGYLIRESALLIALFFIAYILYKKRIKKEYFLVPFGVLLIFSIESLMFFAVAGNPLFRSMASQQFLLKASIAYNYFGRLDFPLGLLHYPWLFLTNNLLSFFYIFIFIAIGYSFIYKKREAYSMLFWFMPLILYLSFGSASLSHYIPFRAVDRYLAIVTIPALLLLAFFLTEKNELIRKAVMPLTLILLLLTSIGAIYLREDRDILGSLKSVYPDLEKLGKKIYMDGRSLQALGYISGYKSALDAYEYPEDMSAIKDSYVVINSDMIKRMRDSAKRRIPALKLPSEIDNPPEDWIKVKEIGKGEKKISIYYIR